ncbi:MAG TPA: patatin-like phospholipase family protein, partial [Pirellulales bacterium]|nr:patatin-like phospholipase family protein [Pirellulales bacterium]
MAKRILAIDGGGIRGVIAASWLWLLEEQLQFRFGKNLHDVFDVFAGTSTGAVIAAGLACKGFDAERISKLYRREGGKIFDPRGLLEARWLWQGPKYTSDGLQAVLEREFGDRTLRDVSISKKRLLVVTFDAFRLQPVVFDSDKPEHHNYRLSQVCQASASAPTYFPPTTFFYQNQKTPFLDGGMAANNPATIAIARVAQSQGWPGALLCSIGTGREHETVDVASVNDALQTRSNLGWARPAINMLFAGSSAVNDEVAAAIVPDGYFRFQTDVPIEQSALDNVNESNLGNICQLANAYWNQADTQLKIERLLSALDDAHFASLTGKWDSTFTWGDRVRTKEPLSEIRFNESSNERVIIQQSGKSFCGETDREVDCKYPSRFHGRFVGEH